MRHPHLPSPKDPHTGCYIPGDSTDSKKCQLGVPAGGPRASRLVRLDRKMPSICPILREAINLPIYCQYLESQEPILSNPQRDAPAGEKNFELPGTKIPKSLKKSRAARPRDRLRRQKTHFYPQKRPMQSEDPAKMTYSISDFWGQNELNLPIYCQYLESCLTISNKNT